MCGIGGEITFNDSVDIEYDLRIISDSNYHRGPDHQSIKLITKNIGLTHNRLSIIDLSPSANQPISTHSKQISIVFNGEIYNYLELKSQLIDLGYIFQTQSDTEVILAGYEIWGIQKTIKLLRGMFSFAIVDQIKNKLLLSRDYFGKKPLYYYQDDQRFIFSSEIKPLSKLLRTKLTLNYNSIDYYLTELSTPQPNTIWNEIMQVPRNSHITLDISSQKKKIEQSQEEIFYAKKKINTTEKEAIIEIEKHLKSAINRRTVADVPISCFLSGGVDSGLISSILAKESKEKIKTFTLGFDYEDFNEFDLASKVSKKYNTEHHEIKISPDIKNTILEIAEKEGEPFADSSIIPTYLITNEIKKHVKVAISGDGGDEIFGGYHEYETAFWADQLNNKFTASKILTSKILSRVSSKYKNLGKFVSFKDASPSEKLCRDMGFSNKEKLLLYKDQSLKNSNNYTKNYLSSIWERYVSDSFLSTLFNSSLNSRLINDYLVKIDRASMLNSVEVRSPFLDLDLLRYTASIPNEILLKNGNTKYLLKKLSQKYFDQNIFEKKKQGFGLPIKYWINNELSPLIQEHLNENKVLKRGLFNPEFITELIKSHKINKNNTHKIWALLILEIWLEKNFDE